MSRGNFIGAWLFLLGIFIWPATQMYSSTELVVNRLKLAEPAEERMKQDFPSVYGAQILGIQMSSEDPIVCAGNLTKTCGAFLGTMEEWAESNPEILEYRSYATYDQTDLDEMKDMFVADEQTVLVCVSLPRSRLGEGSKAYEREQRIIAALEGMLPSSVRMSYTGVNVIKNRVEQDTQRNALMTELVTVPCAMALFAWIFRSSKPVLLLVMQLGTVAVLSFGSISVVLQFQRVPIMDTTQCVVMELFALAFTTDYTFLMLRRYQQERERGSTRVQALSEMSSECGHVVKVSGGLIAGMVISMVLPQLENLGMQQFSVGMAIMMAISIQTSLIGIPFWIVVMGIDFKPAQRKASSGLSYGSLLSSVLASKVRTFVTMGALLLMLAVPSAVSKHGLGIKVATGWDQAWTTDVYLDAKEIIGAFPILNQGSIVVTGLNVTNDLQGALDAVANVTETIVEHLGIDEDDVWSAAGYLGDRLNAREVAERLEEDAVYREIWKNSIGVSNESIRISMVSRTLIQSDDHVSEWQKVNRILKDEPLLVASEKILRYSESEGYLLALDLMRRSMWSSLLLALVFAVTTLGVILNSVFLPIRMVLTVVFSLAAVYAMEGSIFGSMQLFGVFISLPLLFGLALDYELFLVLRVKEYRWKMTSSLEAVQSASVDTNKSIMLAGLVMMISFSGFCWMDSPLLHELGFVIEVGIFLDTFVVRPWIVPCMMSLGEAWLWWPSVPPMCHPDEMLLI